MPPKTWGPPIWYLIHGMVYHFNSNDKRDIQELFNMICIIISSLPCPKCSLDGMMILKGINGSKEEITT